MKQTTVHYSLLFALFLTLSNTSGYSQLLVIDPSYEIPIRYDLEYVCDRDLVAEEIYEKGSLDLVAGLDISKARKIVNLTLDHANEDESVKKRVTLSNKGTGRSFIYKTSAPVTMYDFQVEVTLNIKTRWLHITVTAPARAQSERALEAGETPNQPTLLIDASDYF